MEYHFKNQVNILLLSWNTDMNGSSALPHRSELLLSRIDAELALQAVDFGSFPVSHCGKHDLKTLNIIQY